MASSRDVVDYPHVALLAFICTGPDACQVKPLTLWILGTIWSTIVVVTTVVLNRQTGGVFIKLITWALVVSVVSYLCLMAYVLASFDTRF